MVANATTEASADTTGAAPPAAPTRVRRIEELPGPRGLPVLGNLLQVRRERLHRDVEAWVRRYGPVFRFRLGRRRLVVVADPDAVSTVLRDRPDGFRRTSRFERITREMGLRIGVFGAEGEAWRRHRRMVMASFDPGHVRAYFPSLLRVAQRLDTRWRRNARSGVGIDLQADLMRYTVDAIAGLAFGADVNTLESDDDVIQRHLDKIFPALFARLVAPVPWWRWVRTPADREVERSIDAVRAAIDDFIRQARARLDDDPSRRERPRNLLEAMLVAADTPDSGIDDDGVAANVLTMLLAGEDTTANTLAWLIHLLHRHPQAMARARDEVRGALPDLAAATPARLDTLAWLEACIHEAMRLKPVAPFMMLEALRDTTVADLQVPAGTVLWIAMRCGSHDERHFPQAGAFDPGRWLGAEGAAHAASTAKRVSMPFGAGPRICPGRYLAMLEMKTAMAMLLSGHDIVSVEAPGGGEADERLAFVMSPVGLSMRLAPRA